MRPSARQLARRRELLVATAQLQRLQLGLALRQAPWRGPWLGAGGAALALIPLLVRLWRRIARRSRGAGAG